MRRPSKTRSRTFLLAFPLALLVLAGCDKKPETPASQVAAKVNGDEITVHQVNQALSRAGNVPKEQQDWVRKNALDSLINQQLLAAKAVEDKLDRTPETLMAIDSARREILARAYMNKLAAAGPKLQSGDVTRYYYAHPELFAERKLYNLQEIVFQAPEESFNQIKSLAQANAPTEKIVEFMKGKSIPFRGNGITRPAEQIPESFLKKLSGAKDGESLLIGGPQNATLVRLVATRKQPVDEATATPAIQRYLLNRHVGEMMEKEVKSLRDSAKIEFVGSFASLAKLEAPKAGAVQSAVTASQGDAASANPGLAAPPAGVDSPTAALPASQGVSVPLTLPRLPHEESGANMVPLPTGPAK